MDTQGCMMAVVENSRGSLRCQPRTLPGQTILTSRLHDSPSVTPHPFFVGGKVDIQGCMLAVVENPRRRLRCQPRTLSE